MINKLKKWWRLNKPIITTQGRQDVLIISCMMQQEKINSLTTWAAINPVIHDLEKLRKDTWNQDKITKIQEWLRDNFEVKNDNGQQNTLQ